MEKTEGSLDGGVEEKMKAASLKDSDEQGHGDSFKMKDDEAENAKDGSGDCKDFFLQIVNKKTNIYSTKPVALKSPWTFWIDRTHNGMKVKEFEQHLHRIFTVYSVHEFWRVLCNIPLPSHLDSRTSLHFTRDTRRPIWEESYNSRGGTFRFRVCKKDTDKVWRELLMATASEQWDDFVHEEDDICGVSVSVRERDDAILIWNKDATLHKSAKVFQCVQLLLPDTTFIQKFYKPHISHHAFEKSLAAAAATSEEGISGVLKREGSGGGDGDRGDVGNYPQFQQLQ